MTQVEGVRAASGTPTEAGPIVKRLKAPSDGSSQGRPSLDRATILEIKSNPDDFYVNVHNRPYPDGAVRGRLSLAGV